MPGCADVGRDRAELGAIVSDTMYNGVMPGECVKCCCCPTSACQLSAGLLADAGVGSGDQDRLPIQSAGAATHSTCNPPPQHRHTCTHTHTCLGSSGSDL